MTDEKFNVRHPYEQKGIDPDAWIDCFRAVFLGSDEGKRALAFLAKHWHFYDRSLRCEEWCVQRQCFIDILICCGVWQNDVQMASLRSLVEQTQPTSPERISGWLRSWGGLRTKRTAKKEGQHHGSR